MPLLTSDKITMHYQATSWEEAVRAAGRLLVSTGAAQESYIEAMVSLTKELGPYIVITPGIAIPHARPEEGALKVGFSVVQLNLPLVFGNPDNDPVWLVIGFCSPNASAHVELLMQLARIIGQEGFLDTVKTARTPEELVTLFNQPTEVQ